MPRPDGSAGSDQTIARIENKDNPDQVVAIKYFRAENAFLTSGIQEYFGEKEILIPVHLVVSDFELIGAILSAILEKLSRACERDASFSYAPDFEVLGRRYLMAEEGPYVKLSAAEAIYS